MAAAGTLRAGIVGLTGIGSRPASPGAESGWGVRMPHSHVSAYHHVADTELVAVCDLVPDLLAQFQSTWGETLPEVNQYTDYDEMLAKENLDIVSVVTGDHVHANLVIGAAEAGVKGIVCEKPLATTLADADRMIAAVDKAGIPMLVDHTRRWTFPWVQVGELLRSGEIGDVLRVVGSQGGPRAMLFRNGTHFCDTLLWLAGGNPTAVYAVIEKGFEDYGGVYASDGGHDPDTDPAMSIMIEFDNDVRGFWNACKQMPRVFDLEVFGSKGRIRVNKDEAFVIYDEDRGQLVRPIERDQYTQGEISGAVTELVELIRNGGKPSSTPREARNVLEVLLGALQSQANGNVRMEFPITDA